MRRIIALMACVGGLSAGAAQAATCVQTDESRDNLNPDELRVARGLMEQALRETGRVIDTEGAACTEIFRVTHARLGESITVVLEGPAGSQQMTAASIEELPRIYPRLVESVTEGKAVDATVGRHTVTREEAEPKRVDADGLAYLQIGYGATFGHDISNGPALGGGYRFELDRFAVDVGIQVTIPTDSADGPVGLSLMRGMGLYFFNPEGNMTPYVGGGLGLGFVIEDEPSFGLQGEGAAGFEMLRASRIRLFVQADVSVPFYEPVAPSLRLTLGFAYPPMKRLFHL